MLGFSNQHMNSYKDLDVYHRAIELSVHIYRITDGFPKSELYGLVSQIRRCTVSIPSNIAEGQKRGHKPEYIQFLRIALGSGAELETQLLISQKIEFLTEKEYEELNNELQVIMRMLSRLITVLSR